MFDKIKKALEDTANAIGDAIADSGVQENGNDNPYFQYGQSLQDAAAEQNLRSYERKAPGDNPYS